jgi:quercetin dioxygenase-like cupin family protein
MTSNKSTEPLRLTVPDLAEALDFFTNRLGFRLDMIVPADAPQRAVVSGQGLTMQLLMAEQAQPESCEAAPELVVSRSNDDADWHAGRAGMQYRDLLPGRLGGRLIASHIRIPVGGPVPDSVHYHKVDFQLIYCKAGWVRVVYEDQGPPFVLAAGDCVLQAPQIRHRVLEASPGLEVIELGVPAVHETWVEHELELPTPLVKPDRLFGGQRFVHHRAREAEWRPWHWAGFSARDTGIAAATQKLADVHVVRADATAKTDGQATESLFLCVLQGELILPGRTALQGGDCCFLPAGFTFSLQAKAGLELLAVCLDNFG